VDFDNYNDKEGLENEFNVIDDLPISLSTIQEYTTARTDSGSSEKTWIEKEADVECILENLSDSQKENLIAVYQEATHRIFYKIDVDIVDNDRVVINNVIYEILAVLTETPNNSKRVMVKQIIQ